MSARGLRRWLASVCVAWATLAAVTPALGAAPEPDFVYMPEPPAPKLGSPPPPPIPPPNGYLNGPCGVGVDPNSRFYLSDYFYAIDLYTPSVVYLSQLANTDSLGGPCGMSFDAAGNLYVNNYHRNVVKFGPQPGFAPGPVFDTNHPTGVAVDQAKGIVYVDDRTHIAAYDTSGEPILDEGEPLRIGEGTLGDGYGLAASAHFATQGYLYVADASTNTVKVYDPATDTESPIATLEPPGGFVSLRDSALAVDRVSGEIYVADNTQPQHTERPRATIHAFGPDGAYEGHLKYQVIDALPPGLAVDNSAAGTQGRVYVTSGNTAISAVYAYPPSAAVTTPPQPPGFPLALKASGAGEGRVSAHAAGRKCDSTCLEEVPAGARVTLEAEPGPGSAFAGWSGACQGTGACEVAMDRSRSVAAEFTELAGPPAPPLAQSASASTAPGEPTAAASEVAQSGNLRVTVDGSLAPRRLPRRGTAPISVSVGSKITTVDGSHPPQLRTLRIEINRNGEIDYAGLPVCPYNRIQPASTQRALAACRPALIGQGRFEAEISLAGQEPYPTSGKLLVFNGKSAGKPVLYGQIYSPQPFATSFVIVFEIAKLRGAFGTALTARLPEALGSWGNLTGLQMTLSRRYTYRHKRHSYLSAGCPAPKGFSRVFFDLARTTFSFSGGKKLVNTVTGSCRAR